MVKQYFLITGILKSYTQICKMTPLYKQKSHLDNICLRCSITPLFVPPRKRQLRSQLSFLIHKIKRLIQLIFLHQKYESENVLIIFLTTVYGPETSDNS